MSITSTDAQTSSDYSDEKKKATQIFLDQLQRNWRAFWIFTEETGECSTKPFDGIL